MSKEQCHGNGFSISWQFFSSWFMIFSWFMILKWSMIFKWFKGFKIIKGRENKIRGEQRTVPWQWLLIFLNEDFQPRKFGINSIWELETTKHSNPSVCDRPNGASHFLLKASNLFVLFLQHHQLSQHDLLNL